MRQTETLNKNLRKTLRHGQVIVSKSEFCPDIRLFLFDPEALQDPLSHDETQAVLNEPAYWSFCWASGQILAQFILSRPERVKNKTVVDVGSGSGVVAIAAALAGARSVYACDIDLDALAATRANSELNKVTIQTIQTLEEVHEEIDVITAADVLYDRDNFSLLSQFTMLAGHVLLADSRVKTLPVNHYLHEATLSARTWPDLNEFDEFNQVKIYSSTR